MWSVVRHFFFVTLYFCAVSNEPPVPPPATFAHDDGWKQSTEHKAQSAAEVPPRHGVMAAYVGLKLRVCGGPLMLKSSAGCPSAGLPRAVSQLTSSETRRSHIVVLFVLLIVGRIFFSQKCTSTSTSMLNLVYSWIVGVTP